MLEGTMDAASKDGSTRALLDYLKG
ncbi:MAG: hypothetical protein RIR95_847, partial [Pseudomonadota bacterium]